jgi:DNA-directed RNA polymerase subunit M/transcription elongation factor TFIIS
MSDDTRKVVSFDEAREKQKQRDLNRLLIEEGVQGVTDFSMSDFADSGEVTGVMECPACHQSEVSVELLHHMVSPGIPEFYMHCPKCEMDFMDVEIVTWNLRIKSALEGEVS